MKDNETVRTLRMVLLQRKGGKTSARMIEQLFIRPYNTNQIAKALNISYNTAYHHFKILFQLQLVEKHETKYGTYYEAKENLIREKESFEEIKKLI